MSFAPGTRVRTSLADPDQHTRLPRYARGQIGEVIEAEGMHRLPDDSARNVEPAAVETVYAVRFRARDLWGSGDHTVTLDLWESYLREVL